MSLKVNLEANFAEYVLDMGKVILWTQQMRETNPQLWEKQSETILQAMCALLNSGGGVIKAEIENEDYDYEIHGLGLDIPPSFSTCLDVMQQQKFLLIFVKSWNTEAGVRVATLCSNLYYRERASTNVVDPQEALAFLQGKTEAPMNINSLRPQGARSAVQYEENIKALAAALFNRMQLQYLETLNFPKSTHVEFTMFSADVSQCVKDRLPKCISALANTEGGYIFFGVHEETRQVIGCETDKIGILTTTVEGCIRKLSVHHFCTQRPEFQRAIKFLEVRDKGVLRGYVCAVKVERFCCAMFAKEPSSWEVKDNCVKPLTTKKWVALMMEADPDLFRFPEMVLELSVSSATPHSRAVCSHKNLERLQEQQKHYFPVLSDRVVYTPVNLYKELFSQHKGLRELINAEIRSVSQGVLIFSKSWAVDLGLQENQRVICEVLLISQNNTPIFYSIFGQWDMTCKDYSMIVAQTLKQKLVNTGGYTGRLCITPLVFLLHPDGKTQTGYGADLQIYPESYNLTTTEDVETLLQSLVIVLFGFRSFLSDELGSEVLNLLTDKQYELLSKDLHKTRQMFVHGLPGSGKTVLALKIMEKIRNVFHCEPECILYICENQPLKKFISTKNSCHSVTRKTFMRKDFSHIQHIIIDEAQNFCTEDGDWYRKAKAITQGAQNCPGILWIFLDYFQTNHLRCTGLPPLSDQYPREELTRVVRSAEPIADCLQNIMQGIRENPPPNLLPESLVMLHDPEWAQGVPGHFEMVENLSLDEMVTYVADKCRFFFRNGYSPRDIGVIFIRASEMNECKDRLLAAMRRRRMSEVREGPDVLLQIRDAADIFGNHIVLDDVHRFSGLERNIVFGITPRAAELCISPSLLFGLVSRAKNHLYILNVSF